jgi:UPF0755 protein
MVRKLLLLVLVILLCVGGYFVYTTWLSSGGGEAVIVRIPEGAAFDDVLDSLDAAHLLANRMTFRILAKATGGDAKIKPGTYKFQHGISNAQLLNALVEGRSTVKVRLTFPEGITIRRIASIASQEASIDSAEIVRLAGDREFLRTIGINAQTAEGYLMPDTYFVFWGEKPAALLKRMSTLFKEFYDDEKKALAARQNLTPYEAVILASIVEGEARVDDERRVIAGLYLNRLRKGIRLEADPTLQYVVKDGPRRLLYSDLKLVSPYNTYLVTGLPPTPINNPGRASIEAVLNPAQHDYIYMVARADGSGRHTFSRTGAEHAAAVRIYRERTRENRE